MRVSCSQAGAVTDGLASLASNKLSYRKIERL
jgi:hypothetical protein